jgi:hypothetical protein
MDLTILSIPELWDHVVLKTQLAKWEKENSKDFVIVGVQEQRKKWARRQGTLLE